MNMAQFFLKSASEKTYEGKKIFNILNEIKDDKQREKEEGVLYSLIDSAYDVGDGIDNFLFVKANKGEDKTLEENGK